MPRSKSMSGLTPAQKLERIEKQLLREGEKPIILDGPLTGPDNSRPSREGSLIPAHVPPEDLLNSWPLLKRTRALMAGVVACSAFGMSVLLVLLLMWWRWGFVGMMMIILAVEGAFAVYSSWRFQKFNSQPKGGHEPPSHDGWKCFQRFIQYARMRGPDGKLLLDVGDYMNVWFQGVDFSEVKRENVMDLFCYGFFYRTREQLVDAGMGDIPEQMLKLMEEATSVKFPPGRNPNLKFMAHLWEPVRHVYRPLVFYIITEFTGILASQIMTATGFVKHHHAGYSYYTFEGDPDAAKLTHKKYDCGPLRSSLRKLSVMGKPLPEAKPIVFLHGVGLGILPYVDFIYSLVCSGHPVVVVEYRHVAMRLCTSIPTCSEVADGVVAILDKIGVHDACFVSHSYGTFVLARILKSRPQRVFSACFIDPVCMGMYLPKLLSTFVYRKARSDNIMHFIQDLCRLTVTKELGIAATMCRGFAWSELNVWPDELPDGKTLLVFSGQDVLVPTGEMMKIVESNGGHHKVMYNSEQVHGEFLARPKWKLNIINEVVNLALVDIFQSDQEAEAERLARRTTLLVSVGAMDDLENPLMKTIDRKIGQQVRKTLSFPWKMY